MSAAVIDLAHARQQRTGSNSPDWKDDILTLAAYAQMVKAEHRAEQARCLFEAKRDGLTDAWWNWPEDMEERVHENNRQWNHYIAMCAHLATLPAETRSQARVKRDTIGKGWLSPNCSLGHDAKPGTFGEYFDKMRAGCLADDHLFPPSLKLARKA